MAERAKQSFMTIFSIQFIYRWFLETLIYPAPARQRLTSSRKGSGTAKHTLLIPTSAIIQPRPVVESPIMLRRFNKALKAGYPAAMLFKHLQIQIQRLVPIKATDRVRCGCADLEYEWKLVDGAWH